MKHVIAAAFAASTIAGSAFAADLAAPRVAVVAPAPMFSWSGFYVGLNAGGIWGTGTTSHTGVPVSGCPAIIACVNDVASAVAGATSTTRSVDSNAFGVLGGAQIGYNMQSGSTVYGLEADIQGASLRNNSNHGGVGIISTIAPVTVATGVSSADRLNWLGTVRGRVGFALDRALFYATGGLAFGGVSGATTTTGGFISVPLGNVTQQGAASFGSASSTRVGWTLGGGLEYALSNNWSMKFEGLYYDLGRATYWTGAQGNGTITAGPAAGLPFSQSATRVSRDITGGILRVGVNYRFGGYSPVVARY